MMNVPFLAPGFSRGAQRDRRFSATSRFNLTWRAFFWPDLPADMREVLRVLKPGGKLVIIAEIYKGKHDNRTQQLTELTNMAILSVNEHNELFSKAGYSDVRIIERHDKGWICGIARKPS